MNIKNGEAFYYEYCSDKTKIVIIISLYCAETAFTFADKPFHRNRDNLLIYNTGHTMAYTLKLHDVIHSEGLTVFCALSYLDR